LRRTRTRGTCHGRRRRRLRGRRCGRHAGVGSASGRQARRDEAAEEVLMVRPHWMARAGAIAGAGVVASSVLAACSSSDGPADGIGYVVDGAVPTYNVGSTEGAQSAARQAFVRVQTGFSYPGPDGETVLDTDFGTVTPVQGDPAATRYEINPAAHHSDGEPVVCDAMVLACAAQSGTFTRPGPEGHDAPLFEAPVDPTMSQIESIDVDPGSRTATVHYGGDRAPADWKAAFGATSMLPAHVVSAGAGGVNLVGAV